VTAKFVKGSSSFVSPSLEADCRRILEGLTENKGFNEKYSTEIVLQAVMRCNSESMPEDWISSLQKWLLEPTCTHSGVNPTQEQSSTSKKKFVQLAQLAIFDSYLGLSMDQQKTLHNCKQMYGAMPRDIYSGGYCVFAWLPYELVFKAYMNEIMQGEVITALAEGAFALREFELH
jgi:hypothetical protein